MISLGATLQSNNLIGNVKGNRKSQRWKYLNAKFEQMCSNAKTNYYTNIIEDLKTSNPGQWYSKLKRISSHNQEKSEHVQVEELTCMTDSQQAEAIADQFANVANQFSPLKDQDVKLPEIPEGSIPFISPQDVYKKLCKIKTSTATIKDDIPAKVIKRCAGALAYPLADIANNSIIRGEYANLWKIEHVTPVPKVYPPLKCNQLRKISLSLNFSKILEQILSEFVVSEMKTNFDKSQFGQ